MATYRICGRFLINSTGYPVPGGYLAKVQYLKKITDIQPDNRISGIKNQPDILIVSISGIRPDIRHNPNIKENLSPQYCFKSTGLKQVLSHTGKSCNESYGRQFSGIVPFVYASYFHSRFYPISSPCGGALTMRGQLPNPAGQSPNIK